MSYDYDASYLVDSEDVDSWPDDEGTEFNESFSDFDAEARRRRPAPKPVRGASGAPVFRRRPAPGGGSGSVTQAQLEAALARVRQQITANANGIKQLDVRVRTVISDSQKLQAQTRKTVDRLRSDLRTTQTLSALIPMLTANNPSLATVAPLAHLVMGSGGFPGTQSGDQAGAGGFLGNTNNLITIGALAYASGIFNKQ